jgi:hypothetical protein
MVLMRMQAGSDVESFEWRAARCFQIQAVNPFSFALSSISVPSSSRPPAFLKYPRLNCVSIPPVLPFDSTRALKLGPLLEGEADDVSGAVQLADPLVVPVR